MYLEFLLEICQKHEDRTHPISFKRMTYHDLYNELLIYAMGCKTLASPESYMIGVFRDFEKLDIVKIKEEPGTRGTCDYTVTLKLKGKWTVFLLKKRLGFL